MKSYMRHSDDVNKIFMLLEDCVPDYIMSSLLVIGTQSLYITKLAQP